MARPLEMSPQARRLQLLTAARRCFAELGFHGASVSAIVKEAGVARGTFYKHFPGKRQVFQEVLVWMMDEVVSAVQPIDIARPIPEQVRANLARLIGAVLVDDVAKVLFGEAYGRDPECDEALRAFYGEAVDRIQTALRTGEQLGVVQPGDFQVRAQCLLGLIKEPAFHAGLYARPVNVESLTDELIQIIAGGVLAGGIGLRG
jgi:AcrR family transcriptional regulator